MNVGVQGGTEKNSGMRRNKKRKVKKKIIQLIVLTVFSHILADIPAMYGDRERWF